MAKRIFYGVGALLLVVALVAGGTFAYRGGGRKSNITGGKAKYQAHLVENYPPDQEWKKDQEITKEVSVKNMGDNSKPGERWGDIYVRVQVLEYMDIAKVNYKYFAGKNMLGTDNAYLPLTQPGNSPEPVPLMIDKEGNFVKLAADTDITSKAAITEAYPWEKVISDATEREAFLANITSRAWVIITDALFEPDGYYLPTKAGDPNGQYGAYLAMSSETETPVKIAGEDRVPYGTSNHQAYLDNYEVHMWDGTTAETCGLSTHDYVKFVLENEAWIMLEDWEDLDRPDVDRWILDPTTGWATWGQALPAAPKPNETKKLLKAIVPTKDLEDELYYDLYIHMEACSLSDMTRDWLIYKEPPVPNAPSNIRPASLPNASVNSEYASQTFTATGVKPVTWSIASGALPPGMSLSPAGVLSGTPSAAGTYKFKVTASNAGGDTTSEEYTIVVGALPGPTGFGPATLAEGTKNAVYTEQLEAAGATNTGWSLAAGSAALPAGLTLNADGSITGTPTEAKTVIFTAQATTSAGGTATNQYTITVKEPEGPSRIIPLKPNAPFAPRENVTENNDGKTCVDSDFMAGGVYYNYGVGAPVLDISPGGAFDPDTNHYGYLVLADIVDTSDGNSLSDVHIDFAALAELNLDASNNPKLTPANLSDVKADPRASRAGELVIEYTYIPPTHISVSDQTQFKSFFNDKWYVNVQIPLMRTISDGAGGTIKQTALVEARLTYGVTGGKQYVTFYPGL